ncbi:MAG: site-specific tyrosine recombinase XerD [Anaerolineae bacterium]
MPDTFDDRILAEFEAELSQRALSPATIVNYLADLRAFKRWATGAVSAHFSLLDATQQHISRYRRYLTREKKRAVSTINRHLMALRKFYGFAVGRNLLAADPTTGVALLSSDAAPDAKTLTDEELSKLLTAAEQGSRAGLVRRDVAILQLLAQTGLRVGELVNLKTDDLIFANPGLQLRVTTPSGGGEERRIPLPGDLCRTLEQYLQVRPAAASPHLFLSQEGRAISSRTVQRVVSQCARAARLEGVSAQVLRRTFATQLYRKTNDLALVSRRLGHQTVGITEQYLAAQ